MIYSILLSALFNIVIANKSKLRYQPYVEHQIGRIKISNSVLIWFQVDNRPFLVDEFFIHDKDKIRCDDLFIKIHYKVKSKQSIGYLGLNNTINKRQKKTNCNLIKRYA